jgi:hypothetical protein
MRGAQCTGADERKGQKDGRAAADAFYGSSVARAERKRGRRRMQGENGEARGGPERGRDSSGGWHRPPAGGRGRRCYGVAGEGGGVRVTQCATG